MTVQASLGLSVVPTSMAFRRSGLWPAVTRVFQYLSRCKRTSGIPGPDVELLWLSIFFIHEKPELVTVQQRRDRSAGRRFHGSELRTAERRACRTGRVTEW